MKQMVLLFLVFFVSSALAQDVQEFYSDILVSEEIQQEEQAKNAVIEAKKLSSKKLKDLRIKSPDLPKRESKPIKKKASPLASSAPFGLVWASGVEAIKELGVKLTASPEKDYVQSYDTQYLPKPLKGFRRVVLSFGEADELWRILAYGDFIKDDASASGVLTQYKKYYELLEHKYGNAKEFYSPVMKKDPNTGKEIADLMGNPAFLSQLQSGAAVLYATFEDGVVGAALAVSVDGNNQSYIIIDYKNLKLFKQKEEGIVDAL